MLSDAKIALLFRTHTEVTAHDLTRITEPELVASETPGEDMDALVWGASQKIDFFLRIWNPTGKPQ